jgi:hypothetical protein
MTKIFCKETMPGEGPGQMEFNNQNGGSFMNKLFKATALASVALASVIMISCSGSDGKNGPSGQDGAKGVSCRIDDNADGKPAIFCDSEQIAVLETERDGLQGFKGANGMR